MNKISLPLVTIFMLLLTQGIPAQDDVTVYGVFQVEMASFSMDGANTAKESRDDGMQLVDQNMGRLGFLATEEVDFGITEKTSPMKALVKLEDVHLAQAINYLEAYKMEIGLLINFGGKSLEFKRVHNNRLNHDEKD